VNFQQTQIPEAPKEDPKINIEVILNQLTKQQQDKFLFQFSQLNFAQQTYAYNQFLSTPPETQQFALHQFLSLDPQVLIISIQTELNSEATGLEPAQSNTKPQPQFSHPTQTQSIRSSLLTQIDQNSFQTKFSESNLLPIQSNNIDLSQQLQIRQPVSQDLQKSAISMLSKDPRQIPLTFFPQSSQPQPRNSLANQVDIFQTNFVKRH
jgi:hypothetical protein